MFKVDKDAVDLYHISIGVGKTYSTRDINEVKQALEHYYAKHDVFHPDCPLCRAINEEMAAARAKSGKV